MLEELASLKVRIADAKAFWRSVGPEAQVLFDATEQIVSILESRQEPSRKAWKSLMSERMRDLTQSLGEALFVTLKWREVLATSPEPHIQRARKLIWAVERVTQPIRRFVPRIGSERANISSWVYFIQQQCECCAGPIKIGVSTDPLDRLSGLQTSSPFPLKLLAVLPGGPDMEGLLHCKFATDRLSGEWFRPTERLLAYIESFVEPLPPVLLAEPVAE